MGTPSLGDLLSGHCGGKWDSVERNPRTGLVLQSWPPGVIKRVLANRKCKSSPRERASRVSRQLPGEWERGPRGW